MADAYDDDDNDELTFSKEYRETEDGMVIPAKEADFRTYLCDSGAADEIIRLLVGLAESQQRPADPVAFLRNKFDAADLPQMVAGREREDIPQLLAVNSSLNEQVGGLETALGYTLEKIAAAEAAAAAPLLEGLCGSCASEGELEGALDVAKLYAAVSASFPPPAEPAEGEEPPPPYAWAVEGAESPAGTVSAESLAEWAKCSFGYGAALLKEHGSGLTVSLLATAASEASEAVDEAAANGLYAALCSLVAYTEEAKAPPPEEE